MKTPVFVRVYKGDRLVEVKQFAEPQIIIGSGEAVQIRLEDQNVSTIHAMIEERDTGFFLCDLGSQSGTFRNGSRILDVQLTTGDQIRVGEFTLEFFEGVPKPKAPPKPVGQETAVVAVPPPAPPPPASVLTTPAPTAPPTTPTAQATSVGVAAQPNVDVRPPEPIIPPAPKVPESSTLRSLGIKEDIEIAPKPRAAQPEAQKEEIAVPALPDVPPDLDATVVTRVAALPVQAPSISTFVAPKSEKRKTFAPASEIKDLGEVLKPTRGTVIEVVTAWRERVLDTYHFSERKVITLGGSASDDVFLPVFGDSSTSYPLMRLDAAAVVFVRLDTGGILRKEKQTLTFAELLSQNRLMPQQGGLYGLVLEQGESVRVDFPNEVYVYIRYVGSAPKPLLAPMFDFTSTELTVFVMSFVLTAILGLYMALYTPPPKAEEDKEEQIVAIAKFITEKPKPPPPPPPPPKEEKKEPPIPKEDKKPVKPQTDKAEGKAAEIRPKKLDKKMPKMMTSVKQGGEIKTADKDGANAQSVPKKDVTKTGLLGVFGSKGAQNELDQAYSGAGELQGLANAASGTAGSSKNRPGEGLGAALKDTGAGGKGTATVGIAGVGTNGTGFGRNGYGTGGLGERKGTLVIPGGAEESFDTQIDREAIRRVVRSHLREVQYCYERELNQDPNLRGKVLVSWEIGPGGRVLSATVTNSTVDRKAVGDCVVARLKTWRFPEPPADKIPNVTYPFLFQNN